MNIDYTITKLLFNIVPHNQFLDSLFSFFSFNGSYIIIWLVLAALLIIFEEKRDKKFIIYLTLSLLITFFLTNVLLKNIFHRQRPSVQTQEISYCPKDYSFPSGHAAVAFAGASVLAAFDKKRKLGYYAIAVIIAYSRIYLDCHFFLDILGGSILGYVISATTLRFCTKRFV